jgi:hypothetical protein
MVTRFTTTLSFPFEALQKDIRHVKVYIKLRTIFFVRFGCNNNHGQDIDKLDGNTRDKLFILIDNIAQRSKAKEPSPLKILKPRLAEF